MIGLGAKYLTAAGFGRYRITAASLGKAYIIGSKNWLLNATKQAILGAFGDDGMAVINATNAYLNGIAASDRDKATALAGFINEDPMMVCSLGLEPQGVTMPIRGLITNVNITSDVRVYKDNVCQSLFMNQYSSTDTATYSTSPSVRESTYWRLFFHSNNWYYDWFNNGGGRVTGGSAQANVWYEVEFGNRYIKNLKTGTYFINTSKVTKEFGETYYVLQGGRGSDIDQMRSIKAYFKVYDPNGNFVGNIVPTIRKDGTGGFVNLVTGAFLTTEGGIFRELLVNPDGTPWTPSTP